MGCENCDYENNRYAWFGCASERAPSRHANLKETVSIPRGEAAIADIVDKALDPLQFRPEHFGVAKIDVPLVGFRMDFEQP